MRIELQTFDLESKSPLCHKLLQATLLHNAFYPFQMLEMCFLPPILHKHKIPQLHKVLKACIHSQCAFCNLDNRYIITQIERALQLYKEIKTAQTNKNKSIHIRFFSALFSLTHQKAKHMANWLGILPYTGLPQSGKRSWKKVKVMEIKVSEMSNFENARENQSWSGNFFPESIYLMHENYQKLLVWFKRSSMIFWKYARFGKN